MHSLYDGEFIGFKVASPAELDAALREAIVAIDANVLLDLYRFRPQTSQDLIKTLQSLGNRLVVPHQAVREFWRHRRRSQASPRAATAEAAEALDRPAQAMTNALKAWSKKVGVQEGELDELIVRVKDFVKSLQSELREVLEETEPVHGGDTILGQLDELLVGRVTPPLSQQEWEDCVTEARRRILAEEPPGYKDADKGNGDSPEGGAGDYLVWYQATRYAKEHDSDLILVTRDEKEDWWWRQQSEFIGPRPELVLEYHQLSGRRFFLMRPAALLTRASILQVEVDQESSVDAGRTVETEVETPPEPWTLGALSAVLERLDCEAPAQASALRFATLEHGGKVDREQIYELAGYSDDRMLRGFTKPFRRLTEALQAEGVVPSGVSPLFEARYPDGLKASYFCVPPEVPSLLTELAAGRSPTPTDHPTDRR